MILLYLISIQHSLKARIFNFGEKQKACNEKKNARHEKIATPTQD
jgi:hypothetical protein